MSTVEIICEKAKALPDNLQAEALGFVEYLSRRGDSAAEAARWRDLLRETQALPGIGEISDDDIAAEINAHRTGR